MGEHKRGADGGGHRFVRSPDGAPDDFVEQQIVRGIFLERSPPQASFVFRSFKSTLAGRCVYGRESGLAWNEWNIGVAAASYCDIGFRPRINSIVRNMLLVEYIVESTVPRHV